MKALKEKRVSLRSLFRRSLVILSILALAFVGCGDSDSGSSNGGNGGNGGDPVTPPPSPTVTSIVILQQPVNESYQGLPPDLTGVIAEVYWSDGRREVVSDTSKFFSLPGYCDFANFEFGSEISKIMPFVMSLGYVGSHAVSASLYIPLVIPADTIEITGNAKEKWYADRRPDFTGLSYEITFKEGYFTKADLITDQGTLADPTVWFTGGGDPVAGDDPPEDPTTGHVGFNSAKRDGTTLEAFSKLGRDGVTVVGIGSGKYKKVSLPMSDAYPKVVLTQAKSDNKVTVRVGSFSGGTGAPSGASGVEAPYGGYHHMDVPYTNPNTEAMVLTDGIQTTFAIKEYLEVSGIEFVSANFPDIFDDDGTLFYAFSGVFGSDTATAEKPLLNKAAVLDQFEKWDITFKVFYFGGETRNIKFDEFMGNNAYYNNVVLSKGAWNDAFDRTDVVITADRITYAGGLGIMVYDEDSGNWNVTLEYTPVNYRAGSNQDFGAWVTQVDVPIPVYIFDDTIVVRKNATAGLNNIRINGGTTDHNTMDLDLKDDTNFTDAVNAKWIFEGTYAKGRDRKQRQIKFNDEMFLWAELLRVGSYPNNATAAGTYVRDQYVEVTGGTTYDLSAGDTNFTNNYVGNTINNAVATHPDYSQGNATPDDWGGTALKNTPAATPKLTVLRDHWIGVYYRGQYLSSEDAILVDIINLLN